MVKAWDKELSQEVALKYFQASTQLKYGDIARDVAMTKNVEGTSSHVVQYHDLFEVPDGPLDMKIKGKGDPPVPIQITADFVLSMELIRGHELQDTITAIESLSAADRERAVWFFTQEILEGVAAIHAHCVAHRDLKPENIMATTDRGAVIIDLGLACAHCGRCGSTNCNHNYECDPQVVGTPGYFSPEKLLLHAADEFADDMWAVGLIIWRLNALELHENVYPRQAWPRALLDHPAVENLDAFSDAIKEALDMDAGVEEVVILTNPTIISKAVAMVAETLFHPENDRPTAAQALAMLNNMPL